MRISDPSCNKISMYLITSLRLKKSDGKYTQSKIHQFPDRCKSHTGFGGYLRNFTTYSHRLAMNLNDYMFRLIKDSTMHNNAVVRAIHLEYMKTP